jgi:hypothetical protein
MRKTTRREFAFQCGGAAAAVSLGQVLSAKEARAEGTSQLQMSIDIMGLNAVVDDRRTKRAEVLFMSPLTLGMPKHTPFLIANLSDVSNAEDSKPTIATVVPAAGGGVQQLGLWDLTDMQVVARVPGGDEMAGGVRVSAGRDAPLRVPANPDDPEAWRDFRYVADLQRICGDGEIARGLSSFDSPLGGGSAPVPAVVAGRMRLLGGVLEGAIPSWDEHRRVEYRFASGQGRPAVSQPLTDTIRWSVAHDAVAGGNYLALDLVPLRGDRRPETRALMLAQRGRICRLAISNLPTENPDAQAHHEMSSDEMVALHFGAYYELLRVKPNERPLPRIAIGPDDRKATGAMGRPLCPPAWFHED